MPDDLTIGLMEEGDIRSIWFDARVDRSAGQYLDWVHGYTLRMVFEEIYEGYGDRSYSDGYIGFLDNLRPDLEDSTTETSAFANMWIEMDQYNKLITMTPT